MLKSGLRMVCFSFYLPPPSPSVTRNVLSPRMQLTSSGDVDWQHHPKFSFGLRFQITSRRSATSPDGSWLLGNYYELIYLCILGNSILQLKKWPAIMCMCYIYILCVDKDYIFSKVTFYFNSLVFFLHFHASTFRCTAVFNLSIIQIWLYDKLP
jgi:hypothetical protein